MPLLDILGVDRLDQGFTVGYILRPCDWAITHLKTYFNQEFIATDCDETLMHAAESRFPAAHTKRRFVIGMLVRCCELQKVL